MGWPTCRRGTRLKVPASYVQGHSLHSLQWGPWAGAGMANADLAAQFSSRGVGLVAASVGLELLDNLVKGCQRGCVVAPLVVLDWQRLLRPAQAASLFFAEVAPRSWASPPIPVATEQNMADIIAATARELIGRAMLADDVFMSSGLDSLAALNLQNSVAAHFKVNLPATATFDYPTPALLAGFVSSQQSLQRPAVTGMDAPQWRRDAGDRAPASESFSAASTLRSLQSIVHGLLGREVPSDQPLMEVRGDCMAEGQLA